jgi:2-oxoglutarate dehydrogenase E2 component (dihydrolipoamide succinyltransferase)
MSTDVIMPQMGESVAEGTITKWLKQVGDRVKRDEPLFEISTDKVDAEIPAPADGVLLEVIHPEGETVEVNTVVARIGAQGETGGAPAAAKPAPAATKPAPPAASKPAPPAASKAAPAPAPAKPAAPPAKPAAPPAKPAAPPAKPAAPSPRAAAPPASARTTSTTAPAPPRDGQRATREELRRTRSTPLVRRIAAEHGIDIAAIEGTGISGRVTKRDVLGHLESGGGAPAGTAPAPPISRPPAFQPGERTHIEPMTVMRQRIAEHMMMSKETSAHVTTVFEVDFTAIQALRARHKDQFLAKTGVNLNITAFIAQAAVDALRAFPIVNASLDGKNIVYKRDINLGIAVALDWGLIVPVIRNAEEKSLIGLARAISDLAARARQKKLNPDEVQDGTFTITNPGIFGSLFGTPIINQPQVAIMGVGAIVKRPMVVTAADGSDALAVRSMAYLNLSFDHRLLDGATADQFMAHVKREIEEPELPEFGEGPSH